MSIEPPLEPDPLAEPGAPSPAPSQSDRSWPNLRPPTAATRWRRWLDTPHPAGFLAARWLFLRGLGAVFFSAFYSFARQADGLFGPRGILPADNYLDALRDQLGGIGRYFEVPTLLWMTGGGDVAIETFVFAGLIASALVVLNLAPRITIATCTVLFLSLISVAQVFASYQSDGMLLEAGLFGVFFAPRGLRPGLGAPSPPARIARFMLIWEWFRIYFESGIVKLASGDIQWRNFTALDHYYENGPLPTWIAWHVQQRLPHAFHAATTVAILVVELGVVWLAFLPRAFRIVCFAVVTSLQIGIIVTANYAFLNYLVLLLGFLLVDDVTVRRLLARARGRLPQRFTGSARWLHATRLRARLANLAASLATEARPSVEPEASEPARQEPAHGVTALTPASRPSHWPLVLGWARVTVLAFVFYATLLRFPVVRAPDLPTWLAWPANVLDPFRVANQFGLFAVMTRQRLEIEFQGSIDGTTFVAYPFRYKPQDPQKPPGIYAPYQPRFEWNLWFASLSNVRSQRWVLRTVARLLEAEPSVLGLFASDPFGGARPQRVRAVVYRYWFATPEAKRERGVYWERESAGAYGPMLEWTATGEIHVAR